ncbi:MAG TPA: carboxypeptidase regulatory-like domain-containing protein [Gemmatimonadaceae bacterium]|nr:carboxypeptidase regulatory-like domain-containing protein [Gemmatimonadaceae bacterium]
MSISSALATGTRRIGTVLLVVGLAVLAAPGSLAAQGITTGAIGGLVTNEQGQPIEGAQIAIANPRTGARANATTRDNGRYFVQGLEVGDSYNVTVRRIGLVAQTKSNVKVSLSQTTRADFQMAAQAVQLAGVVVGAEVTRTEVFAPSNTGTKSVVSDTAIQRLPTSTRNLTDFVKLTPQASATGAGFSGGGMSNRMNNVQIDGSSERDVFGLGATGTPGSEVNAKGISIDAVKEYQVLLAPFDVRQGNFGGFLLNAVTKSGTNQLQGSAYYYFRNERFGADTNVLRATKFDRTQWGFTVGGPIIPDKLHFFVAPEFTTENTPVSGPYSGQPANSPTGFVFSPDTLARFETLMQGYGAKIGTPGYSNIPNPLTNFFGRLDYQLNDVHRLVVRYNYATGERLRQQNSRNLTTAVYSSNFHDFKNVKAAPVVQLYSNFKNGSFNEMFVGYNNWYNRRTPRDQFPQIRINRVVGNAVTPVVNGAILAGADQFSQGNELDTKTWEFTDNFTKPIGAHTFTVGTRHEKVWLRNLFTQSSYGVWSFANLDSLAAGNANSFRKAVILSNGGNVEYSALQSAFYAQDQWQVNPNLAITAGMRVDVSSFLDDVKYNAAIDSAYGRRTDNVPKRSVQYSPRVGFNWDVTGTQTDQVRGGVGLFVGTPPYVWLENAYVNSGNVITFLNCNTSGSAAQAPAFNVDPTQVNACRGTTPLPPIGDVNFLSKDLKFPQPLRATLAYDRRLPKDMILTFEGLFSKTLNQFFFYNLNDRAPQGTGQGGRVLYDTLVNAATGATVALPPQSVIANGGSSRFSTAIDLKNQNKDYAYNLTAQLRKRYLNNWEGTIAYTYSRARDVQSFGSSTHISNWQFGRTISGRQEDAFNGISLFDQPHKLMATATRTFFFFRTAPTDVSFFYQGISGSPHDYIYGGSQLVGDANGDAFQGNDLIYVPKNALDPAEIQFRAVGARTPAQQATDLENFISNNECLNSQRGKIMSRNSCRLPFSNQVDLGIRQRLPSIRGQELALTLDIFNFGNLVNKNWGKVLSSPLSGNSNVPLVTMVGYSTTNPRTAVPIVTFTPPTGGAYTAGNSALNFWRTQLAVRYSF